MNWGTFKHLVEDQGVKDTTVLDRIAYEPWDQDERVEVAGGDVDAAGNEIVSIAGAGKDALKELRLSRLLDSPDKV